MHIPDVAVTGTIEVSALQPDDLVLACVAGVVEHATVVAHNRGQVMLRVPERPGVLSRIVVVSQIYIVLRIGRTQ